MSQPPYQPYQQYPPPPPPRPYNTMAILSLVLGITVFPPLGIILGNMAKRQIEENGEQGIELARVGVIVGWVLTALYGVFFCIFCGFVLTDVNRTRY